MSRELSLSIVTPSLNQGTFIEEALLSVKDQQYSSMEHIVMDGGSNDDTLAILRRCSSETCWSHLLWSSESDRGQSHALNKGFAAAKGDIIGWLNSDDRYRPGCFRQVVEVFQEHPDVDVVYGDYRLIDQNGIPQKLRREIDFSYFVLLYHRVLYIPTTATFLRRRIFEEGQVLDEDLHYAMDFEFFMRLATAGYRFLHTPMLLGDFRLQEHSKTLTMARKQLEEKDRIMYSYSRTLQRFQSSVARSAVLAILRSCAAALRYSEKLRRGYYFDRFRLASTNSRVPS